MRWELRWSRWRGGSERRASGPPAGTTVGTAAAKVVEAAAAAEAAAVAEEAVAGGVGDVDRDVTEMHCAADVSARPSVGWAGRCGHCVVKPFAQQRGHRHQQSGQKYRPRRSVFVSCRSPAVQTGPCGQQPSRWAGRPQMDKRNGLCDDLSLQNSQIRRYPAVPTALSRSLGDPLGVVDPASMTGLLTRHSGAATCLRHGRGASVNPL